MPRRPFQQAEANTYDWTFMTTPRHPEPLVSIDTVADFLGVTVARLRKWRERGAMPFPAFAVGRAIRFRLSDVDAWLATRMHHNAAEARAMPSL